MTQNYSKVADAFLNEEQRMAADLFRELAYGKFEARAAEEEDEDWEEDFEDGPEIIYAHGEGPEDDDDDLE